jgi:DNA-binding response OmpR family regulator
MEENQSQGKSVLIVEDDLFLFDILTQKLIQNGFHVEGAVDANEAYKVLDEKPVDIILLDLLLPGIGGQEILKNIKSAEKLKNIPVIVASNLDNPEEQSNCKRLGAADYLIKAQHTPEEIVMRVKKVLQGKK